MKYEPKIGDYVICEETTIPYGHSSCSTNIDRKIVEFIKNNIGKIKYIHNTSYSVQYFDIPDDISKFFDDTRQIYKFEVLMSASTKEELEIKISTTKYNI